jgi:hypothetical protein
MSRIEDDLDDKGDDRRGGKGRSAVAAAAA